MPPLGRYTPGSVIVSISRSIEAPGMKPESVLPRVDATFRLALSNSSFVEMAA